MEHLCSHLGRRYCGSGSQHHGPRWGDLISRSARINRRRTAALASPRLLIQVSIPKDRQHNCLRCHEDLPVFLRDARRAIRRRFDVCRFILGLGCQRRRHGEAEIMRRIQTRDLRSKRGVFLLRGAPACFPVNSQGEASNDPGNQDNS